MLRESQVSGEAMEGFEGGPERLELLVERQHRLRLLQDFRVVYLLVNTILFQLFFQACNVLPQFQSARTHTHAKRHSNRFVVQLGSGEHGDCVDAPACIGQISSRVWPCLASVRGVRRPRASLAPGKPALLQPAAVPGLRTRPDGSAATSTTPARSEALSASQRRVPAQFKRSVTGTRVWPDHGLPLPLCARLLAQQDSACACALQRG